MTFHLDEGFDLTEGKVFAITQRYQLIKCTQEFVGVLSDLPLVKILASARNDLCEKVQRIDILQDVGLPVRDKHHVELVERLVDESNVVLFYSGVLSATISQFGKGGKKCFDARARHLTKLPREDSFPAAGADRSREHDL
jgi:hypothetical protein